jgi:hypothetical protein
MKTSAMSDAEFLASFESLEIPGSAFRHGDHVRLAWIYLHDSDFAAGAARFCEQFGTYVQHIGAESKYHETITWFYLVIVFERIRAHPPALNWEAFARSNQDLLDNGMGILRIRYRNETLFSPLARKIFLLPDLQKQPSPTEVPCRPVDPHLRGPSQSIRPDPEVVPPPGLEPGQAV